nr:uncharacterized protein LOC124816251 [Hydra vulgaris]
MPGHIIKNDLTDGLDITKEKKNEENATNIEKNEFLSNLKSFDFKTAALHSLKNYDNEFIHLESTVVVEEATRNQSLCDSWYQIHLEMRITEVNVFCDFMVWTPSEFIVLHIESDYNLNDNFLTQNVTKPTFNSGTLSEGKTLDLILTDAPERISIIGYNPPLSNLNNAHKVLYWNYILKKPTTSKSSFGKSKLTGNYPKKNQQHQNLPLGKSKLTGNYQEMNNSFHSIRWSRIFSNKNVDESYKIFVNKYQELSDCYIPKKVYKHIALKPYIDKQIKTEIRHKTTLWNKLISNKSKSPILVQQYKIQRGIASMSNEYNNIVTNRESIANILNNSFNSVCVNEDKHNIPNIPQKTEIILEVDVYKAIGVDGISPYVLNKCHSTLCEPLHLIYIKSLTEKKLPELWKLANITPIFKKGYTNIASNYRPISLTSIPCEVLESLIRDEIMDYLINNSLLNENQHGFRKNKSCTTNLLETLDIITDVLENCHSVDMLYLDFEKAFDKVPHSRLITKLQSYGIVRNYLGWIENFLTNRKQRVVLGDTVSYWLPVISGVPQGSVLGPLLFLIFINDLPDQVKNPIKLYANDSKIINVIKNPNDSISLQNDINNIMAWSSIWLTKFNYEKSERDLGIMVQPDLK